MAARNLLIVILLSLLSHASLEESWPYDRGFSMPDRPPPARDRTPARFDHNGTDLGLFLSGWSEWTECRTGSDVRTRQRFCKLTEICENSIITEEEPCEECGETACNIRHKRRSRQENANFVKVSDSSLKSIKRIGANFKEVSTGRSGGGFVEIKGVYSKWTVWSGCTRSCLTQRYKWCVKPSVCGSEVVKQTAYCYVEGSYCQKWIHKKVSQNSVSKDDNPQNPYPTQDLPPRHAGTAVAHEGKQDYKASCGIARHNGSSYVPPQWNMLRIIGGRPTQPGKWPWQVVILNRFKEAFCGGTLVAQKWVLTAAHCVRKRLYVRLGEHDLSRREGSEIQMRVKKSVIYPGYNVETIDNDVALLKLPHPVPMEQFGIACLPKSRQPLPAQQLCTIIGWGKKSPSDPSGTDVLHEAQVPIVPSKTCREVYEEYKISGNMFCAGYRGGRKDSCSGDSGGPLMCKNPAGKWTVYGITSFGEGCGKKGKYGIYARLSNYVRWIKRTIGAKRKNKNV